MLTASRGSGQHKDEGAVGHTGQATALQGAGADVLKGEHPEQFTEPFNRLVEQGGDSFRCAIAAGQAGAAAGDHHIHRWIRDPVAQFSPDLVAVIRTQCPCLQVMASGLQLVEQVIATGIVRQAAGVGDGQQGDGEAHGTLAWRSGRTLEPLQLGQPGC